MTESLQTTGEPLRVGVLGTARISSSALIGPAQRRGVRLAGVAARDRSRAESWAVANGIERVVDDYEALIHDPEVEAVYNPLPNSLHAPLNELAVRAGKHVLTEKPAAVNAEEARRVQRVAEASDRVLFEGFHYAYHPIFQRFLRLATDGSIGELRHLLVTMEMPPPAPDDLRWSWPLAGGALMDLGCYGLHAMRVFAAQQGGRPEVLDVLARQRSGLAQIDEWAHVTLALPTGARGTVSVSMDSWWNLSMTATGTHGRLDLLNFVNVDTDDRLLVTTDEGRRTEHLGTVSTYTHQLAAFRDAVRDGRPYLTTPADSVATMELVDDCYRRAGLAPRGTDLSASAPEKTAQ